MVLNVSNQPANLELDLYWEDREPTMGIRLRVEPERVRSLRVPWWEDPADAERVEVPIRTQYAIRVRSDVPIIYIVRPTGGHSELRALHDDGMRRARRGRAMRGLAGKMAVVTGASSGIGKATAGRLLDEGVRVVVVSDRPDELEQATRELGEAGEVVPVVCDVSDPASVRDLAARVENLGGADILVNNAGVWNERDFEAIEYENWQRMLAVNLTGPFLCSQALAPQMAARGGGAIVNTASTNGLVAEPKLAHYNASKGGLIMLTRSMAIDLAPQRIRVNAVAPGVIYTPLIADILDAEPTHHFGSIPLGRVGSADEVASCIAFLASDDASYVTGSVLVCDGGQLAINGTMPEESTAHPQPAVAHR
jgi:3-oxoacyl-[acyl-carrier protein] reductase